MTDDAIPQWALDEAVKQMNVGRPLHYVYGMHCTRVLARMIVKYEKPPVDPDEEALKRILGCVLMIVRNDELFRAALAQYKKEIGRD